MASGSDAVDGDAVRGAEDHGSEPSLLLFMRPGRDRELLVEALCDRYRIETATDPTALESAFDCCLLDAAGFERAGDRIESRRERSASTFLPFVLLIPEDATGPTAERAWDAVDDVVDLPVKRAELSARVANLIERRETSLRLAERERRLAETVEDLRLKERAMDEAPVGITLAEPGDEDNPLTYVNAEFEDLTGYGSEMLGEDCRFLQGEETATETTARIRAAIRAEEPVSVDVLNYRRNDRKFWNRLTVAPIRDEEGTVTNYVGFQMDITDRKIRERRLEVMNRVLNHNLRNKMNLIEGYVDLLREEIDDGEPQSVDVIERTADDLMGIAEKVRQIDHTLSSEPSGTAIALRDRLSELVGTFEDRYPNATFELSLPADDPVEVVAVGLLTAIEEGIENAVKHNDAPTPSVEIRVDRPEPGWVAIEIEDDGPGIPDHETTVLRHGETAVTHAERLGIWLMYWIVNRAGGDFAVSTDEGEGTTLRLSVPTGEPGS
ncbi:PAS domain-containing protein [Halorubrum halodurans]|uniref:PAS domain-containing sensor histidine kinase n=1 Tax=Halorubrum halodurans TaxID=1383851 RepID=A0A256IJM4_9EURY|nr:PAS domain-containing protein [Halorubrum halodurans]OYR56751.1 PAS domain-containing sensor histidine kinase [Halorubrum halodurans]